MSETPVIRQPAPTLEYTCSVCTCGKELSTLYYLLTNEESFRNIFPNPIDVRNIGFTTLELATQNLSLNFCCLMNLRYGIRVPIAATIGNDDPERSNTGPHPNDIASRMNGYKYPEGLPGPLSREKTLTWI